MARPLANRISTPLTLEWRSATGLSMLGLAALSLLLAASFLVLRLSFPSDGTRLEPGEVVARPDGFAIDLLTGQPSPLQAGDVVLAVEGRPLEAWAGQAFALGVALPAWRAGQAVTFRVERAGRELDVLVRLGPYPLRSLLSHWGELLSSLFTLAVTGFIFSRRRAEPAAWALLLWGVGDLSYVVIHSLELQIANLVTGAGLWLYAGGGFATIALSVAALLQFALIFPHPHLRLTRSRFLLPAVYGAPFPLFAGLLWLGRRTSATALDWIRWWRPASSVVLLVYVLLLIIVFVANYRSLARDAIARQQLRWVNYAGLLILVFNVLFIRVPRILQMPRADVNFSSMVGVLFPIALAFAVLRYRLFDIDILINRTLVYGGLTASIVALYALVVAALGAAFEARGHFAVSLAAAGLVAVLFQPLRERLQRAVNRLMHGDRDDPYLVLARLGRRLESALSPEAVLPAIAEMVAQALKLPYVAIGLRPWSTGGPAAEYGLPAPVVTRLPLTYQGEIIGELLVAPRAPGEAFTPAEYRLLENIAHQAGAAAHAVRLTADLRRSRERLVTAREEERRRLRRDLHDGLGPALAAQTLKVGAARAILHQTPAQADELLAELERDIDAALADIRRLVYDLRPPALDELGLTGAVREAAGRYGQGVLGATAAPRVVVEAPEHLPPLPAAVEVAAYRIIQEALTNVVRHAQARNCQVRLWLDGGLRLEVRDDGVGLPATRRAGVGLSSMRERAEELGGACQVEALPGGGTRVIAHLPLSALE